MLLRLVGCAFREAGPYHNPKEDAHHGHAAKAHSQQHGADGHHKQAPLWPHASGELGTAQKVAAEWVHADGLKEVKEVPSFCFSDA